MPMIYDLILWFYGESVFHDPIEINPDASDRSGAR